MRTAANVARFKKSAGARFGGFSEHQDPSLIGPLRCLDCENVILENGRLKKRPGIVRLGGTTTVVADSRIEGLHGTQTQPVVDDPTEFIVQKVSDNLLYDNGALYFWDGTNGWQAVPVGSGEFATWKDGVAPTLNGQTPNFHSVGIPNDGAYAHLFMLDGSANAHKLPLDGGRAAYRVGIPAFPGSVIAGTAGSCRWGPAPDEDDDQQSIRFVPVIDGKTFEGKKYDFHVTFCDRTQVPANSEIVRHPGLESNGLVNGPLRNVNMTADYRGCKVYFHSDKCGHDGELTFLQGYRYTHIRIYARCATDDETGFRHLGTWAHPDYELADDDGVWQADDSGTEFEWFIDIDDLYIDDDHTPVPVYTSVIAAGSAAYDYAPTRNHVPQNMRYFAAHNGRGFWARDDEPFVWYGDPVGILTGGSYESISTEFLPPFEGSISLLAHYRDALLIGTSEGLFAQVGTIASHTNRSAAIGAEVPDLAWAITRIPGAIGPVARGTGSHVVADGMLYFVSKNGLERFDGDRVENVSVAICDLIPTNDDDSYMRRATLEHDPYRHILYMFVGLDIGMSPGDSVGTTGQVFGTVWCYHYRNVDPETGEGVWTRITSVGTYAVAHGYDQRYTAIGMRQPLGDKARLLVGMRVTDGGTPDIYDDSSVHEESATLYSDTQSKGSSPSTANVSWLWQSGHWDLGLLETRKLIRNIAVHIADDPDSAAATLAVGAQMDEGTVFSESFYEKYSRLDLPVGMAGDDLSVKFSGESSVATEILGYAVEAEAIRS